MSTTALLVSGTVLLGVTIVPHALALALTQPYFDTARPADLAAIAIGVGSMLRYRNYANSLPDRPPHGTRACAIAEKSVIGTAAPPRWRSRSSSGPALSISSRPSLARWACRVSGSSPDISGSACLAR